MSNKAYLQGVRAERLAKQELEAEGWTVMRSSGSHGLFDLVAVHPDNYTRLIQVKVTAKKAVKDKLLNDWDDYHSDKGNFKYCAEELWVRFNRKWWKAIP